MMLGLLHTNFRAGQEKRKLKGEIEDLLEVRVSFHGSSGWVRLRSHVCQELRLRQAEGSPRSEVLKEKSEPDETETAPL